MILSSFVGNLAESISSTTITITLHTESTMDDLGWSYGDVKGALSNPQELVGTVDQKTGDPSTAYYIDSTNYVVPNNVTLDVIQVSNRNDAGWIVLLHPDYNGPWDPNYMYP